MSKMRTAPFAPPMGRSPPPQSSEVIRAAREAFGDDPDEFLARVDRLERALAICGGWEGLRLMLEMLDGSEHGG